MQTLTTAIFTLQPNKVCCYKNKKSADIYCRIGFITMGRWLTVAITMNGYRLVYFKNLVNLSIRRLALSIQLT